MTSPQKEHLGQYSYDPLDRVSSFGVAQEVAKQFFYSNKRLVTQRQGASTASIFQYEGLLLGQHRYGLPHDTVLLATDIQGSVMSLSSALGVSTVSYSPHGHHSAQNGLMSLMGFNGEKFDPVTGHYLLGNGRRAFNPVLMRFNSPDRLSPFGKGGINAYAYCSGNPIGRVDPDGESWFAAFFMSYKKAHGAVLDSAGFNKILRAKYGILPDGGVYDDVATVMGGLNESVSQMREVRRLSAIKHNALIRKVDRYKETLGSGFFAKSNFTVMDKVDKKYGSRLATSTKEFEGASMMLDEALKVVYKVKYYNRNALPPYDAAVGYRSPIDEPRPPSYDSVVIRGAN